MLLADAIFILHIHHEKVVNEYFKKQGEEATVK